MAKKKKDKQDEAVPDEEQLNEGESQNETLEENAQDQQSEQGQTQAQDSASGENENQQNKEGQGDPLEIVPQARYVGNSPVRVAQGEKTVMLWPNQVYKNLELTEDVQALLKRRKLEKVA